MGDEDIYGFDIMTHYAFGDPEYSQGLIEKIKWLRPLKLKELDLFDEKILKKV